MREYHTRRDFIKMAGTGLGAALFSGCGGSQSIKAAEAETSAKPNFIIIFTDDQGYQDLGCFGSPKIKTPNVDRMAREGMRFTSFYAQTVCGPSRAALMTGCYPLRVAKRKNQVDIHPLSSHEGNYYRRGPEKSRLHDRMFRKVGSCRSHPEGL